MMVKIIFSEIMMKDKHDVKNSEGQCVFECPYPSIINDV